MEEKRIVLQSKETSLRKIIFQQEDGPNYYSILFNYPNDNSTILCASSQIGCVEDCTFCATGKYPFIKNLSIEQMKKQYRLVIEQNKINSLANRESLYLIIEGMGEPSYNLDTCLTAFSETYSKLAKRFKQIAFRISTIGNPNLIEKYMVFINEHSEVMRKVKFQIQISLHTPFDGERKYLMPSVSKKYPLQEVIKNFYLLSDFLGNKLKFNYILLNYPNGRCNYSEIHLEELVKILDPAKTRIKLSNYSDTKCSFSSPEDNVYIKVKTFLEQRGIQTHIRKIVGQDLNAACGMLHYQKSEKG